MVQEVTDLQARCAAAGQGHILEDWDKLNDNEQEDLVADVKALDFAFIKQALAESLKAVEVANSGAEPAQNIVRLQDVDEAQRTEWQQTGLKMIAEGKAGILLLAGGQGTRLGSKLPKGCYDVGLPSHKSLFQLQAERVAKLQQLAAEAQGKADAKPLQWYIMTSPFTHADTVAHFESHDYFGLQRSQVTFFQQGWLPCLTEEGSIIMETSSKVAKAPDGNGGLYRALQLSGALDSMVANGIEVLDCYCVDNILARVGDPAFLGCCMARNAQVGARVLAKASPEEKVGVFALRNNALQVVEYSEMDPAAASAMDPTTGDLLYNWSNICMHFFRVDWLQQITKELSEGAAYHIARKAIPDKSGSKVAGIKLEMFIFDTFPRAHTATLYEVARSEDFAPVKNAPGSATDSPDTARAAVMQQGKRWLEAAGGSVTAAEGVEVSPLVSYAGEGLEALANGKVFEKDRLEA